jgi:oligopeptide transport system substrate-binding protein
MKKILTILCFLLLSHATAAPSNFPHKVVATTKTIYSSFSEAPKTLDPARAYSADEADILGQIIEPVMQYDYFKRPFTLIPLTATKMPEAKYYDMQHHQLADNTDPTKIAYTAYTVNLRTDINYAPHPAFAKNAQGQYLYLNLTKDFIASHPSLHSFPKTGTRKLTANDYVYQIKRIADPKLYSPIYGIMKNYIIGLDTLNAAIKKAEQEDTFVNLNNFKLSGVTVTDDHTYTITIKGYYPQFIYWLAMSFFGPTPWEVDKFYAQPGMQENNLTFNWQPVGTGPFMLYENNPNKEMILERNPYFHHELFPQSNDPQDIAEGYNKNSGKQLPLIDKLVLSLDKENIPRWNKFLQGYYDRSSISADSFDQTISIDQNGKIVLTPEMQAKGIHLSITTTPSIFYIGFNMLDPVVGGLSPSKIKLRQAIAIALDYEEYIQIFMNGRGVVAQSPIPPGIFGHLEGQDGINPYLYNWHNNKAERKSIAFAKQLLAEAGYPNGINPQTKQALILNYDVTGSSGPDDKARFDWMRKQFNKLGIKLNIRATLYNRFQETVRTGKAQIFSWGWNADYPDPENFLFLLYSNNSKASHNGENAANYANPKFDKLFNEIKDMPNSPARLEKIKQAIDIVRHDTPWVFGLHPVSFTLSHQWIDPIKPHAIAGNLLKYKNADPKLRSAMQQQWNKPEYAIILFLIALLILLAIPLFISYINKQRRPNVRHK